VKVFQSLHKYPKHIASFEKRYGINENTEISFRDLRNLLIEDGFAASYILEPAFDKDSDEIFYTIWDYERLQKLWATENNLKTEDLLEIKYAQIEYFKPDVFYDFSAVYYKNFLKRFTLPKSIRKVYWNGFITAEPFIDQDYDAMITLYRPFIDFQKRSGIRIFELQPAFLERLTIFDLDIKPIDLLIYGQFTEKYFKKRNAIFTEIVKYSKSSNLKLKLHLDILQKPIIFLRVPFLGNIVFKSFPPKKILKYSDRPIFGSELYSTIGQSKYVLNAFPDHSSGFKSNMRMFETLNCGSLLISEAGSYPEGFVPGKNFIEYQDLTDLLKKLPEVFSQFKELKDNMHPYVQNVMITYTKRNQWTRFKSIISQLY